MNQLIIRLLKIYILDFYCHQMKRKPDNEGIEEYFYGLLCLLMALLCLFATGVNYFLGREAVLNCVTISFIGIFIWLYINYKRNGLTKLKIVCFVLLVLAIVSIEWFLNDGIIGSMVPLYILVLPLAQLLFKAKYTVHIVSGLSILLLILYEVGKRFPSLLIRYKSLEIREYDILFSMIISLSFLGFILWKVKKTYEEDRIKMEESLKLQEKAKIEAETYNRLQREFLANMSHDIRTPLHGIIGHAELLLNAGKEPKRDDINQIVTSGELLLSLVNNILDLTKLESNKLGLVFAPFSLRELCKEIELVFHFTAKEKGLNLSFEIKENLPEFLIGDIKQIKQILINLISNAIKFTKKGSVRTSISCEKIEGEPWLIFEVEDTGIGISEEHQKEVFNRFFQVNQKSNREHQGSGLGLIITKNLVELMGGSIEVKSEIGKGTSFIFKIRTEAVPENEEQKKKAKENKEQDSILPPLSILIAEDNEISQMLLQKQLQGLGYDADVASNGLEVLEHLETKTYDLIFIDVQMPFLDGIEASKEIRQNGDVEKPVIVALTANALKEDKEICLEAGMNDYIFKPATIKDIKKVLIKWFV